MLNCTTTRQEFIYIRKRAIRAGKMNGRGKEEENNLTLTPRARRDARPARNWDPVS